MIYDGAGDRTFEKVEAGDLLILIAVMRGNAVVFGASISIRVVKGV